MHPGPNDRIIGGLTPRCPERAAALYGSFLKGQCVITNARTAEMAKLSENAFRDVNIAFANELRSSPTGSTSTSGSLSSSRTATRE